MNNISKSLMIFFFILTGFDVHAIQLPAGSNFEILYEQQFDKEIDKVAFDSYEKDGSVTYYPKIVVLKEKSNFTVKREYEDERFDDERVFDRDKLEISIFSPQGSEIASIKGPEITSFQGGKIYISEGGSYFAILQTTNWDYFYSDMTQLYFPREEISKRLREEKGNRNKLNKLVREKYEAEYGKLEEINLSVYNDGGKMLWRKEPWEEIPYDAGYRIEVSPKDGSLFFTLFGLGTSWIYDPTGTHRRAFPLEMHQYLLKDLSFARDWKYIAVSFKEEPTHFYKNLPGRSSKPGVALLDSNLNLLWKKSLENYLISGAIISPYGSYLAAVTYTMAGVLYDKESGTKLREPGEGLAAKTGYLFNIEGELVMNSPLGTGLWMKTLSLFSENDRYFAARDDKRLSFIDIKEERVIYEKDFPSRIWGVSVSNQGRCALLAGHKVYVVDEAGYAIWDSGTTLNGISLHSMHLLGWDNGNPIIGVTDKEAGEIEIGKVLIDGGKQ